MLVKLGRGFDTAVDRVIGGERLKTVQVSYYQSSWPVLSQQDGRHERCSGRVKHTPLRLYFYSDMRVTMSQTLWPWSPSTVFPVQPFLMYGTVREFLECLAFSLFKMFLFPPKKEQPLYRICNADGRAVLWWYLKQTVTLSDACVWFITALLQCVRAHI